jgi:hypothetical protein
MNQYPPGSYPRQPNPAAQQPPNTVGGIIGGAMPGYGQPSQSIYPSLPTYPQNQSGYSQNHPGAQAYGQPSGYSANAPVQPGYNQQTGYPQNQAGYPGAQAYDQPSGYSANAPVQPGYNQQQAPR